MAKDEFDWHYQHLTPFALRDKEAYLDAAWDIQNSFTGRMDIMGLHRFFIESALEIKNSIKLFESGFIGPAFYSVRTAVELARVVTLFTTKENYSDSDIFRSWKSGGQFPFDGQIKKDIKDSSSVFVEIEGVIPDFFSDQAARLKRMQKYIHKQGFVTFYDRGFESSDKVLMRRNKIVDDFEDFIKNSLIEISILRICVDPFPILLNDPEVYRRIHFESMTVPFSDVLMELIGSKLIQSIRSIPYYRSHVEHFAGFDEISDEALSVINDNYYDRNTWSVIEPQLPLLPVNDRIAIILFQLSSKISKVYSIGGLHFYFSDVPTNRKKHEWDSRTFNSVKGFDVTYDEVFLSYIAIQGQEFWIEHNETLNDSEKAIFRQLNTQGDAAG